MLLRPVLVLVVWSSTAKRDDAMLAVLAIAETARVLNGEVDDGDAAGGQQSTAPQAQTEASRVRDGEAEERQQAQAEGGARSAQAEWRRAWATLPLRGVGASWLALLLLIVRGRQRYPRAARGGGESLLPASRNCGTSIDP